LGKISKLKNGILSGAVFLYPSKKVLDNYTPLLYNCTMTTYNLSANIRNGNASATQNVGTGDTINLSLTVRYGAVVQSRSNIGTATTNSGGGSDPTTLSITITFYAAGAYSIVYYQSYFGRTYTLTGTATGATNFGYGAHVYDASGNIRMNMQNRQPRLFGFISGTGTGSSFNQSVPGYNTTGRTDEFAAFQLAPNSNYFVTDNGTANQIEITRADVRTSSASFQVLGGSEDYRILIVRV
jgi:hypothetical protein